MKSNKQVLREAIRMMIRESNARLLMEVGNPEPEQVVSHMQEVKDELRKNESEIRKIIDSIGIPGAGLEMPSGMQGLGYRSRLRSMLNKFASIDKKHYTDFPYGIIVLSTVFSEANYDSAEIALRILIDTLTPGQSGIPIFEARDTARRLTKAGTRLLALFRMRGIDQRLVNLAEKYILKSMNNRQIRKAIDDGISDIADYTLTDGWTVKTRGGDINLGPNATLSEAIEADLMHNAIFDDILKELEAGADGAAGVDLSLLRSMLGSDPPTYYSVYQIDKNVPNIPGASDFLEIAEERINSIAGDEKVIADIFAGATRKGGMIAKNVPAGKRAAVPRGTFVAKIAAGATLLSIVNDLRSTPMIPQEALDIAEDSAGNHHKDIRVLATIFRDYMEDSIVASDLEYVADQVNLSNSAHLSPGLAQAVADVVTSTSTQ